MKSTKLISLQEHNSRAGIVWIKHPVLNGIACPECGEELIDTHPNIILTSLPAQKEVHCSSEICEYKGYRNA